MEWITLGRADEFRTGIHRCSTPQADILVTHLDGHFFAFDPICPHGGGSLINCEVEGSAISCPLHGWTFDLRKHGCETHGFRGLRTYATRIHQGALEVSVSPTCFENAAYVE